MYDLRTEAPGSNWLADRIAYENRFEIAVCPTPTNPEPWLKSTSVSAGVPSIQMLINGAFGDPYSPRGVGEKRGQCMSTCLYLVSKITVY